VRVEVFFGPGGVTPADTANRVVVVIDVLRASTTIAVALANGAKTVIPLDGTEDVVTRARAFDRSEVRPARLHTGCGRGKDGAHDDDEWNSGHRSRSGRS